MCELSNSMNFSIYMHILNCKHTVQLENEPPFQETSALSWEIKPEGLLLKHKYNLQNRIDTYFFHSLLITSFQDSESCFQEQCKLLLPKAAKHLSNFF